jgi:hypothetical protein
MDVLFRSSRLQRRLAARCTAPPCSGAGSGRSFRGHPSPPYRDPSVARCWLCAVAMTPRCANGSSVKTRRCRASLGALPRAVRVSACEKLRRGGATVMTDCTFGPGREGGGGPRRRRPTSDNRCADVVSRRLMLSSAAIVRTTNEREPGAEEDPLGRTGDTPTHRSSTCRGDWRNRQAVRHSRLAAGTRLA